MPRKKLYWFLAIAQLICALAVVSHFIISVFGLSKTSAAWEVLELLEIAASLGLILGSILGALLLRSTMQRNDRIEDQLKMASGAFAELIEARFMEWKLTASERDVALFSLKGLSIAEIATLRGSKEGTVKAQSNAIYRKAGVTGRAQLLSLFMDDLINIDTIAALSGTVPSSLPVRSKLSVDTTEEV